MLDVDEAISIVKKNTKLEPKSAEIVDKPEAGSEFR